MHTATTSAHRSVDGKIFDLEVHGRGAGQDIIVTDPLIRMVCEKMPEDARSGINARSILRRLKPVTKSVGFSDKDTVHIVQTELSPPVSPRVYQTTAREINVDLSEAKQFPPKVGESFSHSRSIERHRSSNIITLSERIKFILHRSLQRRPLRSLQRPPHDQKEDTIEEKSSS